MPEIRALVVDDEPLARRGIRQLLAAHRDIVVVAECRDGREALRALSTLSPDLVFLDIQMPGVDGFSVIRLHGIERMPPVVFVTAHDQFAVRAFEAQALDYLVKPVTEARFRATMARVRERIRLGDAVTLARQLTALLAAQGREAAARAAAPGVRIPVATETGELLLESREISWIEADDYHVLVHAGKTHRLRESLATLEDKLDPAQFVRVHRAAIVRLDAVRELQRDDQAEGGWVAVLRDGTRIPVSRRRQAAVRALLHQ